MCHPFGKLGKRPTAMADSVLDIRWQLGERLIISVWLEDAVISETAIAAFLPGDHPFASAFKQSGAFRGG